MQKFRIGLFLGIILSFGWCQTALAVRLVFVGDLMVHQSQLDIAYKAESKSYDFSDYLTEVRPLLAGDVLIGNFETVLGGSQFKYTGYPAFNSPDEFGHLFKDAGFKVLLLANNHCLDYGGKPALRSLQTLREMGFATSGLFAADEKPLPLLLEVQGLKLGFINYTYGSNMKITPKVTEQVHLNVINLDRIAQDVAWLREQGVDFIVASFHFGMEYQLKPNKAQKRIALYCQSLGIDAIIGTHPHVLQPLECLPGEKPMFVAWSLGNFISGQRTEPRERSIILALDVEQIEGSWQIANIGVAPTWVELSVAKKVMQVRRTELGTLPEQENISVQLSKKLAQVNAEVLSFLGITALPENGFYSFYHKIKGLDR